MIQVGQTAPPWQAGRWFNTPCPIQLSDLRGWVVVLYAFHRDGEAVVRKHGFGREDDLALGAVIGSLIRRKDV